jgi:hypothetical protein
MSVGGIPNASRDSVNFTLQIHLSRKSIKPTPDRPFNGAQIAASHSDRRALL